MAGLAGSGGRQWWPAVVAGSGGRRCWPTVASGGRSRLATGKLYTALDRLAAGGYVELVREQVVHGRPRRSYGLTSSGSGALRAEALRMADAALLVTDRGRRQERGTARQASPA